jgi:hypothetical protein
VTGDDSCRLNEVLASAMMMMMMMMVMCGCVWAATLLGGSYNFTSCNGQ